jgi:uncharacterized protein
MSPSSPTPHRTLKAALVCVVAGMMSTLLGVGGGIVLVPLFAILGVMRVKNAAGTSLAIVAPIIGVGLLVQVFRAPEDVYWGAAVWLAAGAFAGTFFGRWIHSLLPDLAFRYAFCFLLLVISAQLLGVGPDMTPWLGAEMRGEMPSHVAFLLVVGWLAGVVAVTFGLGGGVIAVPALALAFGVFEANFTAARATSLAMILPTSVVGAVLHTRARNVDYALVRRVVPFAVIGAVGGVLLAYVVDSNALKVLFAVLLLLSILRMMRPRPEVETAAQGAPEAAPGESKKNLENPRAHGPD